MSLKPGFSFALLALITIAACARHERVGDAALDAETPDDATTDAQDAAVVSDAHLDASTPTDASASSDASAEADAHIPTTPDASADASSPDASIPASCAGPVAEASLCVGAARGRAGERVVVPLHVVLPAGCPHTTQIFSSVIPSAPVGQFVRHVYRIPECWGMTPMSDRGSFMYLTDSAQDSCPISFGPGLLVDLELDIAAGTAPGEYDLALGSTSLGDNIAVMSGGCRGAGAIGGRLTVLP
jgi:hypothetical protein